MNTDIDISRFRDLYPFKSNYLKINGFDYHYVDEGAGDPVVMVHGNPTWSFYFRALITALAPKYRCLAVDHIGCGLSQKPSEHRYGYRLANRIDDLEQLLAHLAIRDKITLVLHDWGGMIGMAYALRHPQRITRIVLMNTAAFLPPGNKRLPLRLWLLRHGAPLARAAVLGGNLFAFSALFMATAKGLSPGVRAGLIAPYNSWHNRIATLKFVQDIPLQPGDPSYALVRDADRRLGELAHLPMLICWGKRDFVFDPAYLAAWRRRFPDAEVHCFADAGHYVLEDAPVRVTTAVKQFLKSNPIDY